ncbi:MAG: alpha/beta hydrolase fold domain-containing protein, partial [Leptospiraceae bacterium]|nr:alpha/beta hydrolase fold domain-containing protein [Leptospiraceae bacterium]
SYEKFETGYMLTRAGVEWYRSLYLPEEAMRTQELASPLLSANHRNLAPALIITAEFDVLHDDGLLYAEALEKDGTPVEYRQFPGVIHGFLNMHRFIPESDEAMRLIADFMLQPHS